MLLSGPKGVLVARCVDGELWGALPPCPRCRVGKLRVAYAHLSGHRGQGDWTCRGVFDKDLGANVRCYYTAGPGVVERERWRDADDPAPTPSRRPPPPTRPPEGENLARISRPCRGRTPPRRFVASRRRASSSSRRRTSSPRLAPS